MAARTLREIRLAQGVSLRALQETIGVNRAILSQIERGTMLATARQTRALEDALGVRLATRVMLVEEAAG